MYDKVYQELDRLQAQGIIEPLQFSDWRAPIIPVLKADVSVRICRNDRDYKITVNRVIKLDTYLTPRIEDLHATLAGGITFIKIDLNDAYLQIPLEESWKPYVTINTSKALFRYKLLPFGISVAPGIFQRRMDKRLKYMGFLPN